MKKILVSTMTYSVNLYVKSRCKKSIILGHTKITKFDHFRDFKSCTVHYVGSTVLSNLHNSKYRLFHAVSYTLVEQIIIVYI
jgi:hypothetical protein